MQESRFVFHQITDANKPPDEETDSRSRFFCHSAIAHVRQNLSFVLNRCRSGEFGEEIQAKIEDRDQEAFFKAVKNIAASGMHLSVRDQGGSEAPVWLIRFLFLALTESDSMFPDPPTLHIIEERGSLLPDEMMESLTYAICSLYGLSDSSPPATVFLAQFQLMRNFLGELLLFALTQPQEALGAHLEMYRDNC